MLGERDDGTWTLEFSGAGHLPPLLITHDDDTRYLTGGHGLLLGVDAEQSRPTPPNCRPPAPPCCSTPMDLSNAAEKVWMRA
ncbi:SpoIIE family protein phosphatase [Streptomyces sp. NPDC088760]|uniref:SpoIIE family protein phosphatase n=1 Tax=Streptomyces sp. NPDC088760 TaxID=3365890 RepID=UPI00380A56FF